MPSPDDQQFAVAVARLKFVKPEHVKDCLQVLANDEKSGEPARTLAEVLVERGFMGAAQVEMVAEAEAKAANTKLVGPYEVVGKLGEGGMGVVYQAKISSSGALVALKVLSPKLAKHPEFSARFRREAEVGMQLKHSNIVKMLDAGEDTLDLLARWPLRMRVIMSAMGSVIDIMCALPARLDHARNHSGAG